MYDLCVIGGGPGGLQAAAYGSSEGLRTCLLEGGKLGGQIVNTPRIENLIGLRVKGETGQTFIDAAVKEAKWLGVEIKREKAEGIAPNRSEGYQVHTTSGVYLARSIILAVGASWVTHPAACEGTHYGPWATRWIRPGHYLVVGGGNSAAQGILKLAERNCRVTIACRHELECSEYLADRIRANPGITVRSHTELRSLRKEGSVYYGEMLDNEPVDLACDGVFFCLGVKPNTAWLKGFVLLDDDGFVVTDFACRTLAPLDHKWWTLPGVFAIGDCRAGAVRRGLANALGDANTAFAGVWKYLHPDKAMGKSSAK